MNNDRMRHILIVDDEEDLVRLIRYTLKRHGYMVTAATCGDEAIACLDKKPDLILLDLWLPGEDGGAVCKRIRTAAAGRAVPVIFFTAFGEVTELQEITRNCGAQDFIVKPFETEELFAKIQRYLAGNSVKYDGK
ncbi:MAG: response regulator [Candidatus Omnitrophica bacterium]|nr:response regulator [Candidatus Omnitrophota bacterium]